MRFKAAMVSLIAVAALGASPDMAAVALPSEPESTPESTQTVVTVKPAGNPQVKVSPAESEDLRRVAKEDGISVAEATKRWGWQSVFQDVTGKLEAAHPGTYSGAAITGAGSGAWIGFKGPIPAEAVRLARTLPVPVKLIGNKGFSEKELNDATVSHFYRVTDRQEVETAEGGYEITDGTVTISAVPRGRLDAAERRELLTRLQPARSSTGSPISVNVKLVDKVDTAPAVNMHGGGFLNGIRGGDCTAAFTVRRGKTYGIATAHHCSLKNSVFKYYNHNHKGAYTLIDRRGSHGGRYGDMAWYSVGRWKAVPWFYYAPNKQRWVRLYSYPRVGQRICKYGRTTSTSCDTVYKNGQCAKPKGLPRYCGMTATHRRRVQSGDSGGPWYWGNDAYGITYGYKSISDRSRDVFTPVGRMYEAMGVSVYLSR